MQSHYMATPFSKRVEDALTDAFSTNCDMRSVHDAIEAPLNTMKVLVSDIGADVNSRDMLITENIIVSQYTPT